MIPMPKGAKYGLGVHPVQGAPSLARRHESLQNFAMLMQGGDITQATAGIEIAILEEHDESGPTLFYGWTAVFLAVI